MQVRGEPGAEGYTLPLRMYFRMFPELLDPSGEPKPGILTPTDVTLENYTENIKHYASTIISWPITP